MSQDTGTEQSCSGSRLPAAGSADTQVGGWWTCTCFLRVVTFKQLQCQGKPTFHSPQQGSPQVTLDHCCGPASRAAVLCQATGPQAETRVGGRTLHTCATPFLPGLQSGWVGALLAASLPLHPCPGHRSIHHSLRDVGSLSSAQLCPLLASSPGGWAAVRAALGSVPGVPSMWLAGRARTLGSAVGELKPLSATYMAGRQESEDAEVLGRL